VIAEISEPGLELSCETYSWQLGTIWRGSQKAELLSRWRRPVANFRKCWTSREVAPPSDAARTSQATKRTNGVVNSNREPLLGAHESVLTADSSHKTWIPFIVGRDKLASNFHESAARRFETELAFIGVEHNFTREKERITWREQRLLALSMSNIRSLRLRWMHRQMLILFLEKVHPILVIRSRNNSFIDASIGSEGRYISVWYNFSRTVKESRSRSVQCRIACFADKADREWRNQSDRKRDRRQIVQQQSSEKLQPLARWFSHNGSDKFTI